METKGTQDTLPVGETTQPFVGQWNRLVSSTNWEKGRIVCQWREALIAQGAPRSACSDETWSQHVGHVSSQHVGRLRRVYQRFGDVYSQYEDLYWSHFCAALDWNDAEMWLEGCVQNGWSVSQMRHQRWEALGAPADLKPREDEILLEESVGEQISQDAATVTAREETIHVPGAGPEEEATDEGSRSRADRSAAERSEAPEDVDSERDSERDSDEPGPRPFENLPDLPDDLAGALESFKLAILRHKLAGWEETSRDDVLAALDALKGLALAV